MFRRIFVAAVQCYCGLFICTEFLLTPVLCTDNGANAENHRSGSSKYSLVLVNKLKKRIKQLEIGDSIVIRSVSDPLKFQYRKVRGLEGDFIHFYNPELSEKEIKFVPPGHVWLHSNENFYDSRYYGPVPRGLIIGHKICKINVNWVLSQTN